MYTEELYQSYFEDLAVSLADLSHTPAKEHFFINSETGDGLKELSDALGGRLCMPALVLDEAEIESDGSTPGQKMLIMGGFVVLDRVDPGNIRDLRRARLKCQKIARKLINKMKRDSRANFDEDSPLLLANAIQLGQISQSPTPIILKQLAGWAVEFQWLIPEDITYGTTDFL